MRHSAYAKSALKFIAYTSAVNVSNATDRIDGIDVIIHDKPRFPVETISGTEPHGKAITGVPQAIASIITNPNGSGQSMGNSRALAPS